MVAIVKAAAVVAGENTSTMGLNRAEKRRNLARTIIQSPEMQVNVWVWVMLSDTAIGSKGLDATDTELTNRATAAFDIMAGVTVEDQNEPPPA
jgi:hypothetical protein